MIRQVSIQQQDNYSSLYLQIKSKAQFLFGQFEQEKVWQFTKPKKLQNLQECIMDIQQFIQLNDQRELKKELKKLKTKSRQIIRKLIDNIDQNSILNHDNLNILKKIIQTTKYNCKYKTQQIVKVNEKIVKCSEALSKKMKQTDRIDFQMIYDLLKSEMLTNQTRDRIYKQGITQKIDKQRNNLEIDLKYFKNIKFDHEKAIDILKQYKQLKSNLQLHASHKISQIKKLSQEANFKAITKKIKEFFQVIYHYFKESDRQDDQIEQFKKLEKIFAEIVTKQDFQRMLSEYKIATNQIRKMPFSKSIQKQKLKNVKIPSGINDRKNQQEIQKIHSQMKSLQKLTEQLSQKFQQLQSNKNGPHLFQNISNFDQQKLLPNVNINQFDKIKKQQETIQRQFSKYAHIAQEEPNVINQSIDFLIKQIKQKIEKYKKYQSNFNDPSIIISKVVCLLNILNKNRFKPKRQQLIVILAIIHKYNKNQRNFEDSQNILKKLPEGFLKPLSVEILIFYFNLLGQKIFICGNETKLSQQIKKIFLKLEMKDQIIFGTLEQYQDQHTQLRILIKY